MSLKEINILIVEDNSGDKILLENELLDSRLFHVKLSWVKTFQECSDFFSLNSYDVILLDLTWPDEQGTTLIEKVLKLVNYTIPIIILTGLEDMSLSLKSLDLGVSDYLQKDNLNVSIIEKSILYSIQRNHTISKIKESELWFSTLFDKSPVPIIIYNSKSGKIVDVNQTAIIKYEYTKEEFLKLKITDLRISNFDNTTNIIELNNFYPTKLYNGIIIHKTKNGKMIYMEVVRKTIKIEGKQIKVLLANDVTEKLEVITKISNQNMKLREIAWIQSHELRAPVARIKGIVDVIKTNHNLTEEEFNLLINGLYNSASELDIITRLISQKTNKN